MGLLLLQLFIRFLAKIVIIIHDDLFVLVNSEISTIYLISVCFFIASVATVAVIVVAFITFSSWEFAVIFVCFLCSCRSAFLVQMATALNISYVLGVFFLHIFDPFFDSVSIHIFFGVFFSRQLCTCNFIFERNCKKRNNHVDCSVSCCFLAVYFIFQIWLTEGSCQNSK